MRTHRFPRLSVQEDQDEAVGKLLVEDGLKQDDVTLIM